MSLKVWVAGERLDAADLNNNFGLNSGGTGADGALLVTSGTTQIDLGNASVVVKQYTTFEISGTGKVEFINPATTGTTVIIKTQGNAVLTSSQAPMLDLSGCGGAGGAGGAINANGVDGSNPLGAFDSLDHFGEKGLNGSGAPSGGSTYSNQEFFSLTEAAIAQSGNYKVIPGAGGGGGGGGSTSGGAGGAGGAGGGALILFCRGDINFTTSNGISVDGEDGVAGDDVNANEVNFGCGGGGGGGAAGMALILYNTATAITGTISATGGNGAKGGDASGTSGGSGGGDQESGGGGAGAGQLGGAGGNGGAGRPAGQGNGNDGAVAGGVGAGGGGGNGAAQNYNSSTTYTGGDGGAGGGNSTTVIARATVFI